MAVGDVKMGTAKWFNDKKSFAFITPDDGDEDLFMHQSTMKSDDLRSLDYDEVVVYLVEYGSDGLAKATNVTRPDGASVQGTTRRSYGGRSGGDYDGGSRDVSRGYDGDVKMGTVKWFNDKKVFAFIIPDDGDEDLFMRQSVMKSDGLHSLDYSKVVMYVVEYGSDGRAKAANVTGPDGGHQVTEAATMVVEMAKGKFKAILVCWFLGLGSLVSWNSMLTISNYYYEVFPIRKSLELDIFFLGSLAVYVLESVFN